MNPASSIARGQHGWPKSPPVFEDLSQNRLADETEAASQESLNVLPALDLPSLIDRLQACHVHVDRHDSPDLLGQLHMALRRPVDTVVCTVLDIDPALCVVNAIAGQRPIELLAGATVLRRAIRAQRTIIVLDAQAPDEWHESLRRASRSVEAKIIRLNNHYPQSDPTLVLYSLLSRRLRSGRLPTEQGVLLLDGAAAVAVGACVLRSENMQSHRLGLRDHDSGASYFLNVGVGTRIIDLLSALPISNEPIGLPQIVRAGDVLRDLRVEPDSVIGRGGCSELILHLATPPAPINPLSCIRCGWCYDTCPTQVQPADVLEASQRDDLVMANRAGINGCIECGLCSYVCPSQLPLLASIRRLRGPVSSGASPS